MLGERRCEDQHGGVFINLDSDPGSEKYINVFFAERFLIFLKTKRR